MWPAFMKCIKIVQCSFVRCFTLHSFSLSCPIFFAHKPHISVHSIFHWQHQSSFRDPVLWTWTCTNYKKTHKSNWDHNVHLLWHAVRAPRSLQMNINYANDIWETSSTATQIRNFNKNFRATFNFDHFGFIPVTNFNEYLNGSRSTNSFCSLFANMKPLGFKSTFCFAVINSVTILG